MHRSMYSPAISVSGMLVAMPSKRRRNGKKGPVALNLARLMKDRGIENQHELARLTGGAVKQEDISRILSGATKDPGGAKVMALANALGVQMEAFYDGEVPVEGDHILESFLEFEMSSAARDLTESDKAILRRMILPLGPGVSLTAWMTALTILRESKIVKGDKP